MAFRLFGTITSSSQGLVASEENKDLEYFMETIYAFQEGLNEEGITRSYLKLDAIRSVSKRRIGRMPNKPHGKLQLNNEQIEKVKKHIYTYFVKEDVRNYHDELEILNYIAYHIDNI